MTFPPRVLYILLRVILFECCYPWIKKSRRPFFRWFEVFRARWPFPRCTRHKTWNEIERLQCMSAQEPFTALESFSPLWKCEKVWRRIWTLNRFFNLPLSSFHVNLKIYWLCRQHTASFFRRKTFLNPVFERIRRLVNRSDYKLSSFRALRWKF